MSDKPADSDNPLSLHRHYNFFLSRRCGVSFPLGKSGIYWQLETFDYWASDAAEILRIIEYLEMHPVKAGLMERPEQYR
jgi:hypothetical protein